MTLTVDVVAHTTIAGEVPGYVYQEAITCDADELAEMAGRLCYLAYSRPNPKTASNEGYLANIIKQQHFSVLEHASVTFYVGGVSRSLLAELERHRHFSYSVVSQRYVDAENFDVAHPPLFNDHLRGLLDEHYNDSERLYRDAVELLLAQGFSRKEARGAARAFLPEATSVELLLTGNHRAFREFLTKRLPESADIEIRNLAFELLGHLRHLAPNTYQDFTGYGPVR